MSADENIKVEFSSGDEPGAAKAYKDGVRDFDLFNNPWIDNVLKSMPEKDLRMYKQMGEHIFGNTNFEKPEIFSNLPSDLTEIAGQIVLQLKSGLLPSDLTDDERGVMKQTYGDEWYRKFGYTEDDL